jgi:hypothetical protein
MVWWRATHSSATLITVITQRPPTPHRVDFSAGNDVDRNQMPPAAISGGLSSGRSPASATADLHRSGCLGVVGSAAGESAKLDTGSRLVKTTRCSTSKSSDHNSSTRSPTSVHVVMVYKCSTNRRRRFLVRRLRLSP